MDTTIYGESKYLTADFITNSISKKGVIISDVTVEEREYGERLQLEIEIDKKNKLWTLNRESVKNMHELSIESKEWIGQKIKFYTVQTTNKKTSIIGFPLIDKKENEN